MYSGRQKTIALPPLQLLGLVFGLCLFILLLVLAGRAAFQRARETTSGLAGGLTHGADREINGAAGSSADATGGGQGLAHRGGAGTPAAIPSLSYRTPPIGAPPNGSESTAFISSGEKEVAQASLVPLHELVDNVRRFDTAILGAGDGVSTTGGKSNVSLLLDGLEAQAALVAHPSRYPDALQDDATQATREVRIYLETVRAGGIGQQALSPSDEATLRANAQKHLQNSTLLVSRMDALAGVSSTSGSGETGTSPTAGYGGQLP